MRAESDSEEQTTTKNGFKNESKNATAQEYVVKIENGVKWDKHCCNLLTFKKMRYFEFFHDIKRVLLKFATFNNMCDD